MSVSEAGKQDTFSCFFYGTLMHPKVLERVTGSDRHTYRPAILHGYFRSNLKDLDYPGLIKLKDSATTGMLVQGVTKLEHDRLNVFEGEKYVLESVTVTSIENGSLHPCLTYVWTDDTLLEHTEWDYEAFKVEKAHRWTDTSDRHEYSMLPEAKDIIDGTGGRSGFKRW